MIRVSDLIEAIRAQSDLGAGLYMGELYVGEPWSDGGPDDGHLLVVVDGTLDLTRIVDALTQADRVTLSNPPANESAPDVPAHEISSFPHERRGRSA